MRDVLAVILVILVTALVIGLLNEGGVAAWLREEWRRIRADTWAPGESPAGSVADPRVAKMVLKQRSLGKRMRRAGRTLLAGKGYTPALTKATPQKEEAPPMAAKVVPIRRAR